MPKARTSVDGPSIPLLLLGMILLGWGTSANLLARYAGADLAEPDHRARAISTVVWATTIGAVAGPNALGPAGHVATALGLSRLAGPYVVGMGCFAAAALITATLLRPDPLLAARGVAFGDCDEDLPRPSIAARLMAIWRDRPASAGARHDGRGAGRDGLAHDDGPLSICATTATHSRSSASSSPCTRRACTRWLP